MDFFKFRQNLDEVTMGNSTKVLVIKKKAIALKQQIRNLVPIAKSMKPGAEIANKKLLTSRATLDNLIKQLQQLDVDSSEINKLKEAEDKDPSEYDEEGLMMKDQLDIVMDAADEIYDMVDDNENLPEWCQNKKIKAADYIDSVRDYLMSQNTDKNDD